LSHLCERIDDTTDETDEDGGNTAERDRRIKEDQATERDRELVESTDHGVRCGGCDTNSPGRGVRDEYRRKTRQNHDEDDGVALVGGEVLLEVRGRPVLDDNGRNQEDGDSEEVVVVHGWKLLVKKTGMPLGSFLLSKSLKLVSLMRFLMHRTKVALQMQLNIIHK
jgi:hypothetical protein